MNIGKQRTANHIREDKSFDCFKRHLPSEWVVRKYEPDYGIDYSIELFEKEGKNYASQGEHLYFQLKGTDSIKIGTLKVKERYNVEKQYTSQNNYKEIDVVRFSIETSLLVTVERMGSAVPVILIVVDLKSDTIFYICLNDYIEKVITPKLPEYFEQNSITINIPTQNRLTYDNCHVILSWFAKRPKLFSLFNKVKYQHHEMQYLFDYEFKQTAIHFAKILLRSDAWSANKFFPALKYAKDELDYFSENGVVRFTVETLVNMEKRGMDINERVWETSTSVAPVSLSESMLRSGIEDLWSQICNVGRIFEDIIKEAGLPTYVGINCK